MKEIKIEQLNKNIEFQEYSNQDIELISKVETNTKFISGSIIEYHIYSENNVLLKSNYNNLNYGIDNDNIVLNIEKNIIDEGIDKGVVNIVYNFYENILGSSENNRYYIKEISQDRTEIRLENLNLSNSVIENEFNNFYNKFNSSTSYYLDFSLNFGSNIEIIGVNLALDKTSDKYNILVKLYEPLPSNFNIKDTLFLNNSLSESYSFKVEFKEIEDIQNNISYLRGPNFNITLDNISKDNSEYIDLGTLINSSSLTSYQQVKSILDEKGLSLNIDYTDFSNFVHFSSIYERINNFIYKLKLIESYNNDLNSINNINSGSLDYTNSTKTIVQNKIDNIIEKFDGYEYYLYYESSSYSWPKTNSSKPYTLFNTTSSQALDWIETSLTSASLYDESNFNNLIYSIPEKIRNNSNNTNGNIFVNMLGHHFDNIWIYQKNITNLYKNSNSLDRGISEDLVSYALKSLGLKLYDNQFTSNDLFQYFLGFYSGSNYNYPTPNNENLISLNTGSYSQEQVNKETYKRLYHNLPLLYKTKGTNRGLRALLSCYGIPESILDISEFGDFDSNSHVEKRYIYNLSAKPSGSIFGLGSFFYTNWKGLYNNYLQGLGTEVVPDSVESRIKNNGISQGTHYPIFVENSSNKLFGVRFDYNNVLDYEYTKTNNIITSESINNKYITASLFISGTQGISYSTPIYFPFLNNEWWNILITRTNKLPNAIYNQDNTYNLFIKQKQENDLLSYSSSLFINGAISSSYNQSWSTVTGSSLILNNSLNGEFQDLRLWSCNIKESDFDTHVYNPFSYSLLDSSSYNYLAFRAPLGIDSNILPLTGSSIHPYYSNFQSTGSFYVNGNMDSTYYLFATSSQNNNEFIYYYSPNVGISGINNVKIKINNNEIISGSTLSIDNKVNLKTYDIIQDSPKVEVSISPQNFINKDIINQLGYFNIDNYIGDPRNFNSGNYPDLISLQKEYLNKYVNNISINQFVKLLKYFDNSLFKLIKDFTPSRASNSIGLTIKPTILQRSKNPIKYPDVTKFNNLSSSIDNIYNISSDSGGILSNDYKITDNNYASSSFAYFSGPNTFTVNPGPLNGTLVSLSGSNTYYLTASITNNDYFTIYDGVDESGIALFGLTGTNGIVSQSFLVSSGFLYFFNEGVDPTPFVSVNNLTINYLSSSIQHDYSYNNWIETVKTPSGLVNITHTNDSSFNGNLSGSNLIVTTQSLLDNPLLDSSKDINVDNAYLDYLPTLNNILNNRTSSFYQDADYNSNILTASNFNLLLSGSARKAPVVDSNYSDTGIVNARYKGSKTISDCYNLITASNKSYGNLAAIDHYTDMFAYFDWIGNSAPEIYGAGNVHLTKLIKSDGTIIDLRSDGINKSGDSVNLSTVENLFKLGKKTKIYFLSFSIANSFYSSSILDAGGYYNTILFIPSGSTWSIGAFSGGATQTFIKNPYDSGNKSYIWNLFSSSLDNISNLKEPAGGSVSWLNSLLRVNNNFGEPYPTLNNGTGIYNFSGEFVLNTQLLPIKVGDRIKIWAGSSSFEDNRSYQYVMDNTITNITSGSLINSSSLDLAYPVSRSMWDNISGSNQSIRIFTKLKREDFVVISNITSNNGNPGILIPENYNPNLNPLEIAKKAGIL